MLGFRPRRRFCYLSPTFDDDDDDDDDDACVGRVEGLVELEYGSAKGLVGVVEGVEGDRDMELSEIVDR